MDARPLRDYPAPAYPTRREAAVEMNWLKTHWPAAWRKLAGLGGAAAMFLCGGEPAKSAAGDAPTPASPPAAAPASRPSDAQLERPGIAAVVAPIFEHGEGRGATGCVVISPPVFMSEEEALQVIREELGKAGLTITAMDVELPSIRSQQTMNTGSAGAIAVCKENVAALDRQIAGETDAGKRTELQLFRHKLIDQLAGMEGAALPLRIDMADMEKHVAVEFVCQDEFYRLGGKESMSSVQDFDLVGVARSLGGRLQKEARGAYFGVFYDPAGHVEKQSTEEKAAENRKLLRQQVQDFAKWLAEQGVIAAPASRPAEGANHGD